MTVAGPLVSAGVRRLLGVYLLTGAGFGATEVAVPAFAESVGARASTGGLLLAGWALGGAAGGLVYGSREWPGEPVQRWQLLLGVLAVGSLLPALAAGPVTLALLLFGYGLVIAPRAPSPPCSSRATPPRAPSPRPSAGRPPRSSPARRSAARWPARAWRPCWSA